MVFSLRQIQEKCREQQMPLYIAFIDLTKAFDLVSRDGLFQIFPKIGCPQNFQSVIESFHTNMKGTVQFIDSSSRPFDIHSGVKQGCVLAPTLFEIFFTLLLRHAFGIASEGICLWTRSDGRLFNLGCLRAKTKVCEALIRDMLFADDTAVAVSWAYPGKTKCPTPRSCPEPTFQACSRCSDCAGCVGWVVSTTWRMVASQKTFFMDSWHLEGEPKAARSCTTRMFIRET